MLRFGRSEATLREIGGGFFHDSRGLQFCILYCRFEELIIRSRQELPVSFRSWSDSLRGSGERASVRRSDRGSTGSLRADVLQRTGNSESWIH